jgi:desulfoferrodoxin (superoxide reductase-like protein)
MGKQGVTDEQKAWLEAHIPAFIEVQDNQETMCFTMKVGNALHPNIYLKGTYMFFSQR